MRIIAVSDLTRRVRNALLDDSALQDVWVQGEISNYMLATSGHRYFSLKDDTSALRCALFRGNAAHVPQMRNGMSILAHGRVDFYETRGDCQFYVDAVEDAGVGELHRRFEALKQRLDAEGLFATGRKRALPDFPQVIGIVTSPAAAALRDIIRTLRLRCPVVRVILAPAQVQGDGAGAQVAQAIELLNRQGEAEIILVARGGGSIEELWAFNEEVVARAIANSAIPVVSGVGHETDTTIADFVADVRASTPTAAAMTAVPDIHTWTADSANAVFRMDQLLSARISDERHGLASQLRILNRLSPESTIADARQTVDHQQQILAQAMSHRIDLARADLAGTALRLEALSPLHTLARGYAIVRRQSDGTLVSSVEHVQAGQGLHITLADGTVSAVAGPRLPTPPDVRTEQRDHGPGQPARLPGDRGLRARKDTEHALD